MADVAQPPQPSPDDYTHMSFLYTLVIGNVLMIAALALFLARIHKEPVKSRGAGMTLLSALMCQLHYILTAVFIFDSDLYAKYGVTDASCHTIYITGVLYVPVATVPIFLRSYSAAFKYMYHQASLSGGPKPWHVKYRWTNKPRNQYIAFFAYSLLWLIVAILAYYISPARPDPFTVDTTCNAFVLPVYAIQMVITVVLVVFLLVFVWKAEDFFYIKLEMRILLAGCIPAAIVWISFNLFGDGSVQTAYFPMGAALFINLVSLGLPAIMSFRKMYSPQPRLRKSNSEDSFREVVSEVIEEILETPALRASFEQHLVQTWCTETLLFYCAVRHYSSTYLTTTSEERARAMQSIIDNFVVVGAPNEINIDDSTRSDLIAVNGQGRRDPDVFNRSMREVVNLLEQCCVPQWTMTTSFHEALRQSGMTKADFELLMRKRPSVASSMATIDRSSADPIYKPDAAAMAV